MSRYNKDIFENQIHGKADIKTGTGATGEVFGRVEGSINAISASFVYGDGSNLSNVGGRIDELTVDSSAKIQLSSSLNSPTAIEILASAGGIDIDAVGSATEDITITNTGGSIKITATEDSVAAITITSNSIFFNGGDQDDSYLFYHKPIWFDTISEPASTLGKLWQQPIGTLNWAYSLNVGDNVQLSSDNSVISMGAGNDATFTHDGTTGLVIEANPISLSGSKGVSTLMTPAIADYVDNECVGEIIHLGSATTVAGHLYFFHTNGVWYTTDSDNVDYGGTELLAVALGTNSGTHGMMVRGITRVASANVEGTPALGVSVYISESHTAQFDFTAPSGGSDYVRRLGHCLAIDSGNVLLLFNPSLEHTAL